MVRVPNGGNVAGCRASRVVPRHVWRRRQPQRPAPHARALWMQPIRCRLVVVRRTSVALPQVVPTVELPGDFAFGDTRRKIKRYSGWKVTASRPIGIRGPTAGAMPERVFRLKNPWMLNRSTRILQPAPTPKHRNTGLFEFS